jgi:hypothetical protein
MLMKEGRDLVMEFEEQVLLVAGWRARAFVEGEGDAGTFGEFADGVGERQVLVLHDELDDIAPGAAAEAMPDLARRVDVEAGGFLFVERAEGDEIRAASFQGKIGADDFDEVVRLSNLIENGIRDEARHGGLF